MDFCRSGQQCFSQCAAISRVIPENRCFPRASMFIAQCRRHTFEFCLSALEYMYNWLPVFCLVTSCPQHAFAVLIVPHIGRTPSCWYMFMLYMFRLLRLYCGVRWFDTASQVTSCTKVIYYHECESCCASLMCLLGSSQCSTSCVAKKCYWAKSGKDPHAVCFMNKVCIH